MFESRIRPCLQFQIKRCAAPCVSKVDRAGYLELVHDAKRFLEGKTTSVQADLAQAMAAASEAREVERAAALRDRIKALPGFALPYDLIPKKDAEFEATPSS